MKDDINLLPSSLIAERARRLALARVGHIIGRIYIILVFVLVVEGLLYAAFVSINTFVFSPVFPHASDSDTLQDTVRMVNARAVAIQNWSMRHHGWTRDLPQVFGAMPPEILIRSLSVDDDERRLIVRGFTSSRNAVLGFQDALELLSWVDHVEAPLQNLAVGKGEFTLTLFRTD